LVGSAKVWVIELANGERFREFNVDSAVSTGVGKLIAGKTIAVLLPNLKY